MMAVQRLGAATAAQIRMTGPVSTIVLAARLLDEHLGPLQVAGTVLVTMGVFVVSRSRAPHDVPSRASRTPGEVLRHPEPE